MKKLFVLCLTLCVSVLGFAQTNPPENVTVTPLSDSQMKITWDVPYGTTHPSRLNLFNSADMVTHPGAGVDGADVSAFYGGQGNYGYNAHATVGDLDHSFWIADDFTLNASAVVSQIDFFAYVTGSTPTSSPFTGCYVKIYDVQPVDSTAVPVWTSGAVSCMASQEWTGIYRTTATAFTNTDRPIMKITANINTSLSAGTYWVAVCFTASNTPWMNPRADLSQLSTGNAIQYNTSDGHWNALRDGTSLEQMGIPLVVRGEFVSENLSGFRVYRDYNLLNTTLEEGFSYIDTGLLENTLYCYTVEAVYSTGSPAMSGSECEATPLAPIDPCVAAQLPLIEQFDGYTTGSGNFAVPCWNRKYTTTATSYPYLYTTYHYSGNASVYMYASSTLSSYIIAPPLLSDTLARNVTVQFWLKKSSATSAAAIQVGVMSDPTDINTFTSIQTFTPAANTDWQQAIINLAGTTAQCRYITLRSTGATSYLDDFGMYWSDCMYPSTMEVSGMTTNSVQISWSSTGVSSYDFSYKMPGDATWTDVTGVTDTFYTITGLDDATSYTVDVRVRPNCGSDYYYATSLSFVTVCMPKTAPYVEDFESFTGGSAGGYPVPNCWRKDNSLPNQNFPYVNSSTTNAYSGNNYLYMYSYSATSSGINYVVLPAFTNPLNTLELSFMSRKSSTSATYQSKVLIGIVTDPVDFNTFITLDSLENTTTNYEPYTLSLANYNGPAGYIAMIVSKPPTGSSYGYNGVFIDNLMVAVPGCSMPENLVQTNGTDNSISCSWNAPAGSTPLSYTLSYIKTDDPTAAWTEVPGITDTTYTATGLEENTTYTFKVKMVCSGGESPYTFDEKFITICTDVIDVPYTQDFNTMANNSYMECWTRPVAYASSATLTYPSVYSSTSYAHDGSVALRFSSKNAWAATPPINANIEGLTLNFWAYQVATTSGNLEIGVMSNPFDTSTFELVHTVPTLVGGHQFVEVRFDSVQTTGYNRHIVFRLNTTGTGMYYIDELNLDYTNDCSRPDSIRFSNITTTSAEVTWSAGTSASAWNLRIKPTNDDDAAWTEYSGLTTSNCPVANLIPSTNYTVQVQADCGMGSASPWSLEYSFMTECGIISTLPFTDNFDTYGTGSNAHPTCWTHGCTNTGTYNYYPYLTTTNFSAPASVYFSSGTQSGQYDYTYYSNFLATPRIDDSFNISSLAATFRVRSSSTSYMLMIGFMTDSMNINTFVPYDTIQVNTTNTWEEKLVEFTNYTGTGRFLAFKFGGTNILSNIYLDNFTLDQIYTCYKPVNVSVEEQTQTSITLSWSPGAMETEWEIVYKEDTVSQWTSVPGITDTVYTLHGLNAGTIYQFKIKSVCGYGDESAYTDEITTTTLCNAITTIPYTENFDGSVSRYTNLPDCWSKYYSGTTTTYPYVNTAVGNVNTLPGALYLYATTTYFDIAILPELDASIDLTTLKMSFKAKITTAENKVVVGVMDNPANPNSFEPVQILCPSTLSVWEDMSVYFANYTGAGRFIAIKCGDAERTNTVRIDDIVIDTAESCFMPLDVTVRNISSDNVDISWYSPSSISSCEYVYGEPGFLPDTATPVTISNPGGLFNLDNLQPNTAYTFYVRNICPSGIPTSWSFACNFTTTCSPFPVPYTNNFDHLSTGSSIVPDCWTKTGNGSGYVNSGTAGYIGNYLYLYTSSTTSSCLALPEIDADVNILQLNFFGKFTNLNYFVEVGVMSNPTDMSTFELVETVNARTTVWNEFHIPFTSYVGTGKFIAIRSTQNAATLYIDNLSVTYAPGCVKPANLTATDIEMTSVSLKWRNGSDESQWEVAYGPAGFSPDVLVGGAVSVDAYEDSITITGLTPGTYYDVYVRSICGPTEHSDWSQVYSFRTDCTPIDSLPFVQDFENQGSGTSAFPHCWERVTTYSATTSYPYITSGSLYFYSGSTSYTLATTPPFNRNINTLQMQFDYKASSADYSLIVGVMTDPYDLSTFVPVDTVSSALPSIFDPQRVVFSQYSGNGKHIAFLSRTPAYNYVYIDNIVVSEIPACFDPEGLTVTQITGNTVTLDWSDPWNASPAGYTVRYAEAGTSTYSYLPNVTSHPYVVTGLQAGTAYEFAVMANCTANEGSAYSASVTAQTVCAPQTLPYLENFDAITTNATYQTEGVLPDCWHGYSTFAPAAWQPHVISRLASTSYAFASSEPNTLLMQAYPTDSTLVVLPEFNEPLSNISIAFAKRMGTADASYVRLEVGYTTDPYNIGTFVPVANIVPVTAITRDSVTFQNVTNVPAGARIAFKWVNTYPTSTTLAYRCCIDDIAVRPIVVCDEPTNLAYSNLTANSVVINWNPNGASQWEVNYKKATDASWQTMNVSAPTCVLSTLTAETNYEVRVRALCGGNMNSAWSNTLTFTTPQADACLVPTGLTAQNISYEYVDLTWDANNAVSWILQYKKTSETNWTQQPVATNQYRLDNLDSETEYKVAVKAVCGDNASSDWSAELTVTTGTFPIIGCQEPTNLTATELTMNSAKINWTENGAATSWTINYKPDGETQVTTVQVSEHPYVLTGLQPQTTYSVYVVALCDDGVTATSGLINFTTLADGITDYELVTSLYPNPNNGQFTVASEQGTVNRVQIYDVYGKLLKTVEANANMVELDVRELSVGMYFVRISTEKGVVTKSFVKK